MVYLASYCVDQDAEGFEPVIAAIRDPDGLDEVARWFGRRVEDGGFRWDAAYVRGPEEPYSQIPAIQSVFILAPRNAAADFEWAPVSQYAFVDRQSAESHAAWLKHRGTELDIEVRELALDTPLVSAL